MTHCSVCRQEIVTKHHKNKERKYTHTYCKWRIHNFWKHDLWSVVGYFISSFICFIFLIVAGSVGASVVLRNIAYILLAWTIVFSLWLAWINYLKMYNECCDHIGRRRNHSKKYIPDDEIVTREDILQ